MIDDDRLIAVRSVCAQIGIFGTPGTPAWAKALIDAFSKIETPESEKAWKESIRLANEAREIAEQRLDAATAQLKAWKPIIEAAIAWDSARASCDSSATGASGATP